MRASHICLMNYLMLLVFGTWITITVADLKSRGTSSSQGDQLDAKVPAEESALEIKEDLKSKKKTKKKSKDWSKINFNTLEKGWEDGDEEEELELEFDRTRKIGEKKMQQQGMQLNPDDPKSVKRFVEAQQKGASTDGKPAMMFITLPEEFEGKKWTSDSRKSLCQKWSTLLKSGSVEAELYDIGETSLLINLKKGWLVRDALKFLLQQPETIKVTKDSKDFYLKDVLDDDELR